MLLAIDLGNTNIKCAVFDGKEIVANFRLTTDMPRTSDEFGIAMRSLLESDDVNPNDIHAAIIALAVGVGQFLLDTVLFRAAFAAKPSKMLLALFGKIAVYGGFFYLLFTVLRQVIVGAAVGFGLGFFPGLILWFVFKGAKQIGGGKNG